MQRAALERDRAQRTRNARARLSGHAHELLSAGHFRKSWRVAGCMKPRCWLCRRDKLAGAPTPAERRAQARAQDGIASLYR